MAIIKLDRIVSASSREVYDFLCDPVNELQWKGNVTEVTLKSGKPKAVGAVYTQKIQGPAGRMGGQVQIDHLNPEQSIEFSAKMGPAQMKYSYSIEEVPEGTHIVMEAEIKGIISLTVKPMIEKQLRSALNNLAQRWGGETRTEEDIYDKMIEHLGQVGAGIPGPFASMFINFFTPEEAEVALGLPVLKPPFEVDEVDIIASRVNKPVDYVQRILDGMAKSGFVVRRSLESGKTGYCFTQGRFGLPQMFFWKGEVKPEIQPIAPMMKNFITSNTTYFKAGDGVAKMSRYIPVSQSLKSNYSTVLPHDVLEELIKKTRRRALVHCACRVLAKTADENHSCGHTVENCIKFNELADFVVENGLGRDISMEEAFQIVRKADEEGLIHYTDNCGDGLKHLCNCCSCCCWYLYMIKNDLLHRDEVVDVYYIRDTDRGKCIGCGQCVSDCPLELLKMADGFPEVNRDKCLGCGVCYRNCPTQAIMMKKRSYMHLPASDFKTLHTNIIKSKINRKNQ